jgi:hypothetical protein
MRLTSGGYSLSVVLFFALSSSNGKIKLQGLLSNVSDAVSEANDIIRSADHAKQTGQIEKIVTDMVQWRIQ